MQGDNTQFTITSQPRGTASRHRSREIAAIRGDYGHLRIYALLKREGWVIKHNRSHRTYAKKVGTYAMSDQEDALLRNSDETS